MTSGRARRGGMGAAVLVHGAGRKPWEKRKATLPGKAAFATTPRSGR